MLGNRGGLGVNSNSSSLQSRGGGLVERQQPPSHNDENIMQRHKALDDVQKTPSHSVTKRRAFGDISNRKQPPQQAKSKQQEAPAKPRTVSFQTPHDSTLLPSLTRTQPKERKTAKVASPFAPSSLATKKVDFALPQRTTTLDPPYHLASIDTKPKLTIQTEEPVDDVEFPAGRLWRDQHNDSDDDTTISSIESESNMWDDLRLYSQNQMKHKQLMTEQKLAEAERIMQEQLEAMWKQDEDDLRHGMEYLDFSFEVIDLHLDDLDELWDPRDFALDNDISF